MSHTDDRLARGTPRWLARFKSFGRDPYRIGLWALPLVWTLLLAVSLWLNLAQLDAMVEDMALVAARANFQRDALIRQWAASHGGVYVPVTEQTQPNPYLSDLPERDITTPSGRPLTLMNPAYITRQLHELSRQSSESTGHITSLNPLRPANGPDDWERQALEAFERGVTEVSALQDINGEAYLRLMRPLTTTESCLACHAAQGYQVGDIRGGLSESVRLLEYQTLVAPNQRNVTLIHGLFWTTGLALITTGLWQIQRRRRERDLVSAALRNSEARFRGYFELPLAGRAITSPDKGWLDVNTTLCDMLGYTKDELSRLTWAQLTHPDDLPVDEVQFKRVLAGEIDGYTLEKRFIRQDGQIIYADLAVQCVRRPDGAVDHFVALIQDITERKQAEEALRQSEARWHSVIKTSPDGICLATIDGAIQYASDKLLALHGYERLEELLGRNMFEFLATDYRAEAASRMQQMLNGHYPGVTEYKVIRRDGSPFYAEINAEVLRDAAGQPTGLLLVERDVDGRKRAEDAVRRQNQYLTALQETTLELSAQLDLDRLFENIVTRAAGLVEAAGGFLDMVDQGSQQLLPRVGLGVLAESVQHVARPGEGVAGIVWQTGQPLVINHYDQWTNRIGGFSQNKISAIIGVPLINNKQTLGVLGLAYRIDAPQTFGPEAVTILTQFARLAAIAISNARLFEAVQQELAERSKAEAALRDLNASLEQRVAARTAELQTANRRLTELDWLKDEFLSRISHELRTPLTSIKIYIELLETARPEKRDKYLHTLKHEADRLHGLIEEVLLFSQLNLNTEPSSIGPLDVNYWIESRLTTWVRLSGERDGLQFRLSLAPDLPLARGDGELFIQALTRLIANAAHYTPSGSITVSTALHTADDDHWVTVSVADTGPGITPDDLPHIFERFYRGRAAADYKTPGTGIGLSISRDIAEKLGGRLTVETQVGVGSTFTLWLPVIS